MLFKNAIVFTPVTELKNYYLIVENEKILKLGRMDEVESEKYKFDKVIDLDNRYFLCPGFIDIHTHGALGIDLTLNSERMEEVSKFKCKNGVTMYLPTFLSELEGLKGHVDQLEKISNFISKGSDYSIPFGINLETPYLSPKCGMQKGEYNFPPTEENNKALIDAANGYLKIITIAPELDGAIGAINYFNMNGIITGLGHSLGGIDLMEKAINNGANLATHLFNGTYQVPASELGVIPASLNEYLAVRDDIWAEAIVDFNGAHINPTIMRLFLKAKGVDKLILITDNLFCAGLEDKEIVLPDGRTIYKDYDVYRLKEGDHLGGSGYQLNGAVRNLRKHTGLGLIDCIKAVTKNPAELLNIQNKVGYIRTGMDANLTIINENVDVFLTMVGGKICFDKLNHN